MHAHTRCECERVFFSAMSLANTQQVTKDHFCEGRSHRETVTCEPVRGTAGRQRALGHVQTKVVCA